MDRVLVTGATGLVGLHVVRRLVELGVHPIILARGLAAGAKEVRAYAELGLITIFEADLTKPGLGMAEELWRSLRAETAAVLHIAGHYRLSATREEAQAVNVEGTRRLLDGLGAHRPALHHVSSVVVAGDCAGEVPEQLILDRPDFRNAYETSKWDAEQVVSSWGAETRIYRPGIIVGDSVTGETNKFDGPYAAFPLARRGLPFPLAGHGRKAFPLVTVDLVADCLVKGLTEAPTAGDVVHVLDTGRPTLRDFTREMSLRLTGQDWIISLPSWLINWGLRLPGVPRLTALEMEAVAYMSASWTFSTLRFEALCHRFDVNTSRLDGAYDALATYYCMMHGRSNLARRHRPRPARTIAGGLRDPSN